MAAANGNGLIAEAVAIGAVAQQQLEPAIADEFLPAGFLKVGGRFKPGACNVKRTAQRKNARDVMKLAKTWMKLRKEERSIRDGLNVVVSRQRAAAEQLVAQMHAIGREGLYETGEDCCLLTVRSAPMAQPTMAEKRSNLSAIAWMTDDKLEEVMAAVKKSERFSYVLSVSYDGEEVEGPKPGDYQQA